MPSNVQVVIERMRAEYAKWPSPPLAFICQCHRLSVRKFAEIFGISKSYAADLMHHRVVPPLDLAIRITRYFECHVEDLFGWQIDDDGARRPLRAELPGKGEVSLSNKVRAYDAIALAMGVAAGGKFELKPGAGRMARLKGSKR